MKNFAFTFVFLFWISIAQAKIRLAVTVDDLPSHSPMPSKTDRLKITKKMLKALKKHKVPEVYGFINAGKMEDDPKLVNVLKLWVQAGYPLANHTYHHKSINEVSVEEFQRGIAQNEKALQELNGKLDWKYFRYPYLREGNTLEKRNSARAYLKENKYVIAQVTVDFEDWSWNEPYARCADKKDSVQIKWLKESYLQNALDQLRRQEVLSKALFGRSIAHILLLHVGAFDAEMMDALLAAYVKEGVEFIPLSEAVRDEVYSADPGWVQEWGSEFTYQIMKMRGVKSADFGLARYEGYPEEKLKSVCR